RGDERTTMPEAGGEPGSDGIATRVIRRIEDLDDLEPVWDGVDQGTGSPMQRYEWVRACATAFATPDTLRVVVAGPVTHPTAIAPLVERSRPFPHVEVLGALELDEPVDVVGSDASAVRALAERVLDLHRPLLLKRLIAQSPLVSALRDACR